MIKEKKLLVRGERITYIFLGGLIIHFFVNTFVTFALGWNNTFTSIVRGRKEIAIGLISIIVGTIIVIRQDYGIIKKNNIIFKGEIVFVLLTGFIFFVTLFQGIDLAKFFLAFKYDLLGFFIFFIFYHFGSFLNNNNIQTIITRYVKIIKRMLIGALCRYVIIGLKPGMLKYFGYDKSSFEGVVGERPPAVYMTQLNQGFARNQFLFERPTSRGFFLIAFWPLFYLLVLRKKSFKKTGLRRIIYGVNILTTFSRAARGAWIIELLILGIYDFLRTNAKKFRKFFIPLIIIILTVTFFARDQIIERDFSNTGHLKLLVQGINMLNDHRLLGAGVASVGPGSHHLGGSAFNPENQFLQILIEFGIIGFIGWMILYGYLLVCGRRITEKNSDKKKTSELSSKLLILSMNLGLIGLSICGLVLHSFVDRMIVYPFMAIFGLIIAYHRNKQERK